MARLRKSGITSLVSLLVVMSSFFGAQTATAATPLVKAQHVEVHKTHKPAPHKEAKGCVTTGQKTTCYALVRVGSSKASDFVTHSVKAEVGGQVELVSTNYVFNEAKAIKEGKCFWVTTAWDGGWINGKPPLGYRLDHNLHVCHVPTSVSPTGYAKIGGGITGRDCHNPVLLIATPPPPNRVFVHALFVDHLTWTANVHITATATAHATASASVRANGCKAEATATSNGVGTANASASATAQMSSAAMQQAQGKAVKLEQLLNAQATADAEAKATGNATAQATAQASCTGSSSRSSTKPVTTTTQKHSPVPTTTGCSNGSCVNQTQNAQQNCKDEATSSGASSYNYNPATGLCTIVQVEGNCSTITVINGSGDTVNQSTSGNCNSSPPPPPIPTTTTPTTTTPPTTTTSTTQPTTTTSPSAGFIRYTVLNDVVAGQLSPNVCATVYTSGGGTLTFSAGNGGFSGMSSWTVPLGTVQECATYVATSDTSATSDTITYSLAANGSLLQRSTTFVIDQPGSTTRPS